jgi:predicted transcriptional regulator
MTIQLTAAIVSAYVSNHAVQAQDLPGVIQSVYATLANIDAPEPLVPAVPVKKSITDEYIVCLDTGRKFKSLKRHLAKLGMTPDAYRSKWNLPADYPMVAPAYAAARSALAKANGLGRVTGGGQA